MFGRLSRTLSGMSARSVMDDFSDPAKIARAVGGRAAKKTTQYFSIGGPSRMDTF